MPVAPGFHKIMTPDGKCLTLVTQTGVVTALPHTDAANQTWEFKLSGINYTITNVGYPPNTYAYSTGQVGAPVIGSMLATEWFAVPHTGSSMCSIQYGDNTAFALSVGPNDEVTLAPAQLAHPAQHFSI